ncbi:MAG: CD1845 family protein [Oscillospiraceae bacterium]|nr:CD1845 family protein [Oscillospiraceae bacterium]
MRILLKILLAPFMAALIVFVWFFAFLLDLSSVIFGIAGTVFGLLGILIMFIDCVKNGVFVLIFAFLISPFGLPMLAVHLLGLMQKLRYAIQDRVYG